MSDWWYDAADRPIAPSAATIRRSLERSAIERAVKRANAARTRPIHPSAVALLRAHEGHLSFFGGGDGLAAACDGAASLGWVLAVLDTLLVIAGARS